MTDNQVALFAAQAWAQANATNGSAPVQFGKNVMSVYLAAKDAIKCQFELNGPDLEKYLYEYFDEAFRKLNANKNAREQTIKACFHSDPQANQCASLSTDAQAEAHQEERMTGHAPCQQVSPNPAHIPAAVDDGRANSEGQP